MSEILHSSWFCAIRDLAAIMAGAYIIGWFFAKGLLHEFSNFLVKHFDKYIKSKKEKENGNEKTQL